MIRRNEAEPFLDQAECVKQENGDIDLALLLKDRLGFEKRVIGTSCLDYLWGRSHRHSHFLLVRPLLEAGPLEALASPGRRLTSGTPRNSTM